MRTALFSLIVVASAMASGQARAQFAATVGNAGSDVADCISNFPGGVSTGPISASIACIGNGAGGARASASPGHVGASANAFDFGFGGYETSASASATGDVVFTGVDPGAPPGTTHVSLNLAFGGTLNATDEAGAEAQGASFLFGVRFAGLDIDDLDGAVTCNSSFLGAIGCGSQIVAPFLTTNSILVPLHMPLQLVLVLDVTASAGDQGTSALADFSNSLDFPIGSDVFELPAGVTANSSDLDIVNNRFVPPIAAVPEPSALSLLGIGLAVLWGVVASRRRRRWSASARSFG